MRLLSIATAVAVALLPYSVTAQTSQTPPATQVSTPVSCPTGKMRCEDWCAKWRAAHLFQQCTQFDNGSCKMRYGANGLDHCVGAGPPRN